MTHSFALPDETELLTSRSLEHWTLTAALESKDDEYGYAVDPSGNVVPLLSIILVEALARSADELLPEALKRIESVSAIDHKVWSAIEAREYSRAIDAWRESPARALLVHGTTALKWILTPTTAPEHFVLTADRILQCVSFDEPANFPGHRFGDPSPKLVGGTLESVAIELAMGSLVFDRSNALAHLLERLHGATATDPEARSASTWIERALFENQSGDREVDAITRGEFWQLEEALLPYAWAIAEGLSEKEHQVRDEWRIARWLQTCMIHSHAPHTSLTAVAAETKAAAPTVTDDAEDIFDIRRFCEAASSPSLNLVESGWLHAIVPYVTISQKSIIAPVERYLQKLAQRETSVAEKSQELALSAKRNSLQWPYAHVAPPVLARSLLTEKRLRWLAESRTAVMQECFDSLLENPARHWWVTSAILTEGRELPLATQIQARAVWRDRRLAKLDAHLRLSMAVGLVAVLENEDRDQIHDLFKICDVAWKPFIVDAFLETFKSETSDFTRALEHELRLVAESKSVEKLIRQNAFMFALRRARSGAIDKAFLDWIITAGTKPPFNENTAILRELKYVQQTTARAS